MGNGVRGGPGDARGHGGAGTDLGGHPGGQAALREEAHIQQDASRRCSSQATKAMTAISAIDTAVRIVRS
ncbi:hypothetical protein ACFVH6_43655 [Spirillospora sp. NPDC127200]